MNIKPPAFNINSYSGERELMVKHVPTFMNTCEEGPCGRKGDDIEKPDEFEVAALTALHSISTIYGAPYHSSHKLAAYNALKEKIALYERLLR